MAENEQNVMPGEAASEAQASGSETTASSEMEVREPEVTEPEGSEPEGSEPEGGEAAAGQSDADEPAVPPEEITYHAVEKDGSVTAIWEMQGRKHLRTIDPRSRQGQEILRLYTAEHPEEQ